MLTVLQIILLIAFFFKGRNTIINWHCIISFGNVWGYKWVSECISVGRVRVATIYIWLVMLSWFLVGSIIGRGFTMRRRIVFFLNFLHPHIGPRITILFVCCIKWWRCVLVFAIRCPHCDLRYFIEAVLSLHFNNKNITVKWLPKSKKTI